MTLLGVLVLVLLGVSVFALAAGGAEPPTHIRTFGRSSPEERAFDRRALRLQVLGYCLVGVAAAIGLVGVADLI